MDNHSPWLFPETATPEVAKQAAQHWADTFWFWAVGTAVVGWFLGWVAVLPGLGAIWCIRSSIKATSFAEELERRMRS